MKHKTFDTVLFQQNPPRKRCQMRILPKKCLTDNDHDSIPRLQKNSSPQAPLPRWTKIKMERFVAMSSPSSFCDFSHRWPSKNLRQLFLLVNSLARCSHSRSLTSLSRTNKLIWEGPQKWKMKQTYIRCRKEGRCPTFWSSLAFSVFGPAASPPCFPYHFFQTSPLAISLREA